MFVLFSFNQEAGSSVRLNWCYSQFVHGLRPLINITQSIKTTERTQVTSLIQAECKNTTWKDSTTPLLLLADYSKPEYTFQKKKKKKETGYFSVNTAKGAQLCHLQKTVLPLKCLPEENKLFCIWKFCLWK